MSTKHTPGPWQLRQTLRYSLNGATIVGADGTTVANLTRKADKPIRQKEQDARLIAAAPELLKFAEEWLSRQGTDENYMVSKARAAIAKAIGTSATQPDGWEDSTGSM